MEINWHEIWQQFDKLMELHYREEWEDQQDLIEDIVTNWIAKHDQQEEG